MLRRLIIRDFVIVDRLELEFSAGFGVLTGETGAGKSILLDALGLVLGDRADATLVRTGCKRADLSAEFDAPATAAMRDWLEEADMPLDDEMLLLRRVIDSNGRSRGWINGVPVTLAQLRELGAWLADIHGQHAHHALLKQDTQRAIVDAFAGAGELASEVLNLFREWQRLARARLEVERDCAASKRELELLEYQLDELEVLSFDPDEWESLNQEQRRLSHAAGLISGTDEMLAALGEGEFSVSAMLGQIIARVRALAEVDENLTEVRELVDSAAIQVDEAEHALRRYSEGLELDPARLEDIDRRIGAVTDVARKHRVQPEALPDLQRQWRKTLESLRERANPEWLAAQEHEAHQRYLERARALSEVRRPAAATLSQDVTESMQTLSMPGGRFQVVMQAIENGGAGGLEDIEFRVSANASQPLRPLARVASGGELSRIGLAIQVMTSRYATTPTLLFDEVDVGIGGGVAERVGQLLSRLGRDRQVLCVTHLPQVAACADWQWRIAKNSRGDEVVSEVTRLDERARVDEIARMLGGLEITATTRAHAAELLEAVRA